MAEKSWEELDRSKSMWKNHAFFFRVLRGAVVIIALGLIGVTIYASSTARESFSVNVFTSVMSAVATALIFDELNRKRSQDERKRQLVDDAASISNEVAKNAVHQLDRKGWLKGADGLLKKMNMQRANLRGAVMNFANLNGAVLVASNLQGAQLFGADLRNAILLSANLRGAILIGADLQGAIMSDPWGNLSTAFDESTILPNGYHWSKEIDMRYFTDHNYPNFWRSDDPGSPAYRSRREE